MSKPMTTCTHTCEINSKIVACESDATGTDGLCDLHRRNNNKETIVDKITINTQVIDGHKVVVKKSEASGYYIVVGGKAHFQRKYHDVTGRELGNARTLNEAMPRLKDILSDKIDLTKWDDTFTAADEEASFRAAEAKLTGTQWELVKELKGETFSIVLQKDPSRGEYHLAVSDSTKSEGFSDIIGLFESDAAARKAVNTIIRDKFPELFSNLVNPSTTPVVEKNKEENMKKSVACGNCHGHHESVEQVKACFTGEKVENLTKAPTPVKCGRCHGHHASPAQVAACFRGQRVENLDTTPDTQPRTVKVMEQDRWVQFLSDGNVRVYFKNEEITPVLGLTTFYEKVLKAAHQTSGAQSLNKKGVWVLVLAKHVPTILTTTTASA